MGHRVQESRSNRSHLSVSRWLTSVLIGLCLILLSPLSAQATVSPANGPSTGGTAVTIDAMRFTQVSAGLDHTVALALDGTVWTWGNNDSGQLGDGSTQPSAVPVKVKGIGGTGYLEDVTQVSAGGSYSVAITSSGVVSWGHNQFGQLGTGTTAGAGDFSSVPVRVVNVFGEPGTYLTNVTSIVCGTTTAYANTSQGLISWGYGAFGQLGNGTTVNDQATPVWVLGPGSVPNSRLLGVTQYAAGANHVLAITPSGVVAWGPDDYGQLGNGGTSAQQRPVFVHTSQSDTSPVTNAVAVAAGNGKSLMLTPIGVFAWGNNQFGKIGIGSATSIIPYPTRVVNYSGGSGQYLQGVSSISANGSNLYAVTSQGLYSWGMNAFGESGTGTQGDVVIPTLAINPVGNGPYAVAEVSAGAEFVIFKTSGFFYTAGRNNNGQLGQGTITADTNTQNYSPHLSGNFQPGSVLFGTLAGSSLSSTGDQWSVVSPSQGTGTVNLAATANVYGGTTAGTPATVSWSAGTYTYEAALANTGSAVIIPLGLVSAGAVLLGVVLLVVLRRYQLR